MDYPEYSDSSDSESNNQIEKKSKIGTLASVKVDLETTWYRLLNFENHANGQISDLKSRVSGLQNWINDHNTWAGNLNSRVGTAVSNINKLFEYHDHQSKRLNNQELSISNNNANINTLFDLNNHKTQWLKNLDLSVSNNNSKINTLFDYHDHQTSRLKDHDTSLSKLFDYNDHKTQWLKNLDSSVSNNNSNIKKLFDYNDHKTQWLKNLDASVSNNNTNIGTLRENLNTLWAWKNEHNQWATDFKNSQNIWNAAQTVWNTSQSNRISTLEENEKPKRISGVDLNTVTKKGIYSVHIPGCSNLPPLNSNFMMEVIPFHPATNSNYILQRATFESYDYVFERKMLNGSWGSWTRTNFRQDEFEWLKDKNVILLSAIEREKSERIDTDLIINSNIISMKNDFNERLDNLKFDDIGIIAAIVALMKNNENLWNADHYDGGSVGANDGKAVRLFKNQFQESRALFANLMKHYFDMGDPASSIYRLRYSIVAGFEETKDLLEEWFTFFLQSMNSTNSHLNSANTWLKLSEAWLKDIYEVLCMITDWLKLIYEKPGAIVSMPPVVIPEKENGWIKALIEAVGSVIETAIKTLGNILEAAIGEVGQLLRSILDFLGNLIDDIIGLVVPENLDFMHKKFDSTGNTIKVKFPFIFGWVDSFKGLFGNQTKLEDQPFSLNGMFEGEVKLPFSKLNDFAPLIRGFSTGFVLLGFLIDMYHWFHTKGEVIE